MPVTREELEGFRRFAEQRLGNGGADSIASLADEWQVERERHLVNEALCEATADLDAGRHLPADEVSRAIRQKHNLPTA
jgi:hypothetical protein